MKNVFFIISLFFLNFLVLGNSKNLKSGLKTQQSKAPTKQQAIVTQNQSQTIAQSSPQKLTQKTPEKNKAPTQTTAIAPESQFKSDKEKQEWLANQKKLEEMINANFAIESAPYQSQFKSDKEKQEWLANQKKLEQMFYS